MKTLNMILTALISLLSIAAGIAKVLLLPQELKFFQNFGFSPTLIVVFGLIQITGGVLFAFPKTRKIGGFITILAFALSSGLIFISGNLLFGLASLLPVVLILLTVRQSNHS